ncbi:PREDICTED: uncharacterized protein LOC104756828 [Camelina sativa]|uniref:2-oxoadipate dioxygenase/decarboxylase n=1 Tax=Camelina sativa TaxID=90675 RepID=A0ABM0WY04_CAMSA|nr:PREDICTED: uncharacterized protein LOC104756828 [Camelina sativa]
MGSFNLPHTSPSKGGSETFLRNVFENILKTYLKKNPTANKIWELVQSVDNEKIVYDHFTFKTLKVDGYGIDSLSSFFMDYGYKVRGEYYFPKNLRVLWFSPPDFHVPVDGHGLSNGSLPQLVLAEVVVDELSPESQEIIKKYLKPEGGKQSLLSCILGNLIWEKPTWTDFNTLAKENEFAAWVLIHGYTMNHLAFSVHRFKHRFSDIICLKEYLEGKGFELNKDGGVLKVSQDGLLLQLSSISEKLAVEFADGVIETVPASFIEFIDRQVLPQFKDLPHDQIEEYHRRKDFDFDNGKNILDSARFSSDV